ncbi:hypothetical protein ACYULU_00900 [Breznakiellaceae bacterium SP9]
MVLVTDMSPPEMDHDRKLSVLFAAVMVYGRDCIRRLNIRDWVLRCRPFDNLKTDGVARWVDTASGQAVTPVAAVRELCAIKMLNNSEDRQTSVFGGDKNGMLLFMESIGFPVVLKNR